MTAQAHPSIPAAAVVDGLRRWARGAYAEEAAVELLARSFGGQLCSVGNAWVRTCDAPGWYWLDADALQQDANHLSAGEQRVLAVAGALVSGSGLVGLPGLLAGLDRDNLALVLAAFAHAGGSHEHVEACRDRGRLVWSRLPALVDWPSDRARTGS